MASAIDSLTDALNATRTFLLPFDAGQWLRLAVLTFFVFGSVGGFPPSAQYQVEDEEVFGPGGGPFGPDGAMAGEWWIDVGPGGPGDAFLTNLQPALWFVLALVAIGLVLGLLYLFVGSIMEFVFYESLREEHVSIRAYASEYLGLGVHLFAFRLVLGLIALALVGGTLALFWAAVITGPLNVLATLLVLAPFFLVFGILGYLVNVFTAEFVAPIMLAEDRGVLSAWGRFLRLFRAEWGEFLLYLVVRIVLNVVAGLGLSIVIGIVGVLLAIPFGAVGVLVWFALGGGPAAIGVANVVLIAILGLLYGLVLGIVAAFVAVPVLTYLRYFALFVLGDVDETLDLIADRRTAIRSTGTEPAGP